MTTDKTKSRAKVFIHAKCSMCKRTYTDPTNVKHINKYLECYLCRERRLDLARRWREIKKKYG